MCAVLFWIAINCGFVYTLFNKKESFIENEISEIKKTIREKKQKLVTEQSRNRANINTINELTIEIQLLEQNLLNVINRPLRQIITRDNIDKIFNFTPTKGTREKSNYHDIKSNEYFDLLKYLIRNGYIDETYADYMTYFYENSLSRIDKIFLRSITDKKAKEYIYELKNPQMVVSRLRLTDFEQEEILNFSLLTFLLNSKAHIDYVEKFIIQLKKTKNFKFIREYFDIASELKNFIKYLNEIWPEAFYIALSERLLSDKQIRQYSIYTLYYSDEDTIRLINQDNCLYNYISNTPDYLAIDNPNIDNLIRSFKLLNIRFVGFDYKTINKGLFNAVYQESLYEINSDNIILIQTEIWGISDYEDIIHKNYTLLRFHPHSPLTQYLEWNINKYFDVVLQISDGFICDDEDVAIFTLNDDDITIEHKHSYISALQTTIHYIQNITDKSLWDLLLDTDIIEYSENNIIQCYNALKLNENVISYINRGNIELDFSEISLDKNTKQKLFSDILKCDGINDLKYEQILVTLQVTLQVTLHLYHQNSNSLNISYNKINILINNNIIRMTIENLKFLRFYYPDIVSHFIKKNIQLYADIMSSNLFSQDELMSALTWDISDEIKLKLLKFSKNKISIIDKNYSTNVNLHILDNNFMESDLIELFSSFDKWDSSVQIKIFSYAIKHIQRIISDPVNISKKLIDNIFREEKLNENLKIDLLIAMIPIIKENREYLREILNLLKLNEFIKIFDPRKKPKFEVNNKNEKLLDAFKKNNLIVDYKLNQQNSCYYKIIKNNKGKTLSK